MYNEIAITEKDMQRLKPLIKEKQNKAIKKMIESAEKSGNADQIKKAYDLADLSGVKIKLSDTELLVVRNLHLTGTMGKSGSLNEKQRGAVLYGLIAKGMIDKNCNPTRLGIEVSSPLYNEN